MFKGAVPVAQTAKWEKNYSTTRPKNITIIITNARNMKRSDPLLLWEGGPRPGRTDGRNDDDGAVIAAAAASQ